jgi:hypothetical protein
MVATASSTLETFPRNKALLFCLLVLFFALSARTVACSYSLTRFLLATSLTLSCLARELTMSSTLKGRAWTFLKLYVTKAESQQRPHHQSSNPKLLIMSTTLNHKTKIQYKPTGEETKIKQLPYATLVAAKMQKHRSTMRILHPLLDTKTAWGKTIRSRPKLFIC